MIRDFEHDLERAQAAPPAWDWMAALRRLPQPLHLLEFVARSQHYHFGCFERTDEPLPIAQDRLAARLARHFRPQSSVLDIGCGLGGTSRLLARSGFVVTAIDRCAESVAYAARLAQAEGERDPVRYDARGLQAFSSERRCAFDAAIAIEVLQHFPDLGEFFACCRAHLRPDGVLVLADVSLAPGIHAADEPYHREGRVRACAVAHGYRLVAHEDLTPDVLPTLPRLACELERQRARLLSAFARKGGARARPVEDELAEVLGHMRGLQAALEQGYLHYEATALQRSTDDEVDSCA